MRRFDGRTAIVTEPAAASGWRSPSGSSTRAPRSSSRPASRRPSTRPSPPSVGPSTRWPSPAAPTTPTTRTRRSHGHRDLRQRRPARQQHGHQPGLRPPHAARPRRRPQDPRGQRHRRPVLGPEAPRRLAGEHGGAIVNVASVAGLKPAPASRSTARARRCSSTSPRSSPSSSPDRPGQRRRPRRRQDPLRHRALRGPRRRRSRPPTRSSGSASPRTSARSSRSSSRMMLPGSRVRP